MSDSNILLVHQIQDAIIEIIRNSKDFCFLVTPYFQPWPILRRELEKAAQQQKKIVFILRDTSENHWDFEYFNDEFGFDIIFAERLHTKLYLNESECLITSMNLHESSKDNNFEVGYHFKNQIQSKNFKETVIDNDILMTQPEILKGRYFNNLEAQNHNAQNPFRQNTISNGFCIRCGNQIDLNPAYPMCSQCYSEWDNWKNYNYGENFCHICKREGEVTEFWNSISRLKISYYDPVCPDCRKKYVNNYNTPNGNRCTLVNQSSSYW